jgi:hypothetical protein
MPVQCYPAKALVHKARFDLISPRAIEEGEIGWNADDGTLEMGLPGGDVVLQFGQEQHLPRSKNDSGDVLLNGTAVRISGGEGSNPLIDLADPDSIATVGAIGLTTEEIANNQFGYVTTSGVVRGVDTSAFSAGDTLWLDDDGTWSNVRPTPPIWSVAVGSVIRSHPTEGVIYVTIVVVPRLRGLSDVYSPTTPNDGDIVVWNTANARWQVQAP